MNYFDWANQAITQIITAQSGVFVALGQNLFRGFATILIAWFGIKAALSASDHGGGFHFSQFASLILTISFGFAMVTYYDTPIPGFGTDFHHLITDETQFLSNKLSGNELGLIMSRIAAFEGTVEHPSAIEFRAYFDYWAIILLLAVAQAVAGVVVLYGRLAASVCALVGPMFISFFIVPQLDWLFWGWFKCFIQYAFYQVIAAALVFIVGEILTAFMAQYNGAPIPITQQAALVPALLLIVIVAGYALVKVPELTAHVFSGASGGTAAGMLGFLNPMHS